MVTSELSLTVSRSNIADQIAAFLYATGTVKDSEEITSLIVNGITTDQVPIKVMIKKEV